MTDVQHAQWLAEVYFIAGLLFLALLAIALVYLHASRRDRCRCHAQPAQPVEVRHVLVERAPAELPPRWVYRGQPAALYHDTPAALPTPPPAPPAARPRPLPAAHRRELTR